MMTTGQFYALASAALMLAFWRNRRPDRVTLVLAIGFAASVASAGVRHGLDLLPFIAASDCMIVMAMAMIWTHGNDMRAYSAGGVGLLKCGWTLAAYVGDSYMDWRLYAIALDAAFLLQIAIAGGFVDAVGHWLFDLLHRVAPRRHRLLRNVE